MEGTVFQKAARTNVTNVAPSVWFTIADALGEDAVKMELETQRKWNEGKYFGNYLQWMRDTIEIHKKFNIKKDVFLKLLDSIDYTKGVKSLFAALHNKGMITALVSGGFKYQADRAQRDLNIHHAFAGCEYFWNEQGFLQHYNLLPADYLGKVEFMRTIAREYNISLQSCAFVGDGANDCSLAKAVGFSVAYNAHPDLKQCCSCALDSESIEPVLSMLEKVDENDDVERDLELFRVAKEAANNTYSPFSKFPVGAAVVCASGIIYTGTNIENSSFGLTNCAERVAIQKAISAGEKKVRKVAIYSLQGDISPCGACRQVIAEFSDEKTMVIYQWRGNVQRRKIIDILPHSFNFSK